MFSPAPGAALPLRRRRRGAGRAGDGRWRSKSYRAARGADVTPPSVFGAYDAGHAWALESCINPRSSSGGTLRSALTRGLLGPGRAGRAGVGAWTSNSPNSSQNTSSDPNIGGTARSYYPSFSRNL